MRVLSENIPTHLSFLLFKVTFQFKLMETFQNVAFQATELITPSNVQNALISTGFMLCFCSSFVFMGERICGWEFNSNLH